MIALFAALTPGTAQSQRPIELDWKQIEEETIRHFQTLLRFETTDPPGNERPMAEYLKGVLEAEGIPVQIFALDPKRTNLVARIKGNGTKRPLLLMVTSTSCRST
ncbi:MAG: hypothetical protein ABI647_14405 [Gemmatimonadota bacterium]